MRTLALPGPGFDVGSVGRVGKEEGEVRMRARWVRGRGCLEGCLKGGIGFLMLGIVGIGVSRWDSRTRARLYVGFRIGNDQTRRPSYKYLRTGGIS